MKRTMQQFVFGILTLTMALWSATVSAQTRNNLTRSHNESVNIYGTFQPKIGEALKLNFKPELFTPHFRKSVFDIEPEVSTLPTTITLKPIKPVSIRVGKRQKSFENYFTAGIGSRISPYVEFFHSAGKRNSYQLNFHLFHLSTFKNIDDYLPSPFTSTLTALSLEKYFRYHTLNIEGSYRLNTNRYYGVKLSDYPGTTFDVNNPALKQAYNLAHFGIGLKSHYKNNDKLAHSLSLNSYYYFDKHGTSELNARLNFDAHKAFPVSEILDYQELGIEGAASFYRQADTLNTGSNDLYFRAMPYFNFKYDFVAFKVGLDFIAQSADTTKFHFYPYLHATLNLVPEVLSIFAGIDGGLNKNSFRTLTEENPFLSSRPGDFLWTNNKINLFAGFKGNVAGRFGFQLKYRFQKFDDMAFYSYPNFPVINGLTVFWVKNEYIVNYVSGSSNHFEAGLNYHEGENFKIWINGFYDTYQLENNAIPYFKPKIQVHFGASYLIGDKIEPRLELWYVGAREGAVKPSGGPSLSIPLQFDPYLDLNLSIRYSITPQLSVFLEGTNLLNKKYLLFTGYPVGGIQIMGGVAYRF